MCENFEINRIDRPLATVLTENAFLPAPAENSTFCYAPPRYTGFRVEKLSWQEIA
jgi:hypothetical protein